MGVSADVDVCEGDEAIIFTLTEEGKRSGDALVKAATHEDAEKAMTYNRNYIGKRYIEVVMSNSEEFNVCKQAAALGENDRVVRLRGLAYGASDSDVREFFSGLEIIEGGVLILVDSEDRCMGDGFVEFAHSSDVPEAVKKHRQKIGNRFIEVFRSSKLEMVHARTSRPVPLMSINVRRRRHYRDSPPHAFRPPPFGEPFYSPPHFPPDGRFVGDLPPIIEKYIHIRGLPFECVEADIEAFFSPMPLVSIGLCFNHDGRFNGEADVYFERNSDAHRAMNRDKSRIGRRYAELFLRTRKITHLRLPPDYYPPEPYPEPPRKIPIPQDPNQSSAYRSYISAYAPFPANSVSSRYPPEEELLDDPIPPHYSAGFPQKYAPSNYYAIASPSLIRSPLNYANEGSMIPTTESEPLSMCPNSGYAEATTPNLASSSECPPYPYY